MFGSPSLDDLLEGVIISLQNDILPAVENPKAQAQVAVAQAVLQMVRQSLAVAPAYMAEEHNGMTKVLRDAAAALGDAGGAAADRLRERAATLGARPDFPAPVPLDTLAAAHNELGQGLVDALLDLDELQRSGETRADDALGLIRAHLGPRAARDVAVLLSGAGMVGRG